MRRTIKESLLSVLIGIAIVLVGCFSNITGIYNGAWTTSILCFIAAYIAVRDLDAEKSISKAIIIALMIFIGTLIIELPVRISNVEGQWGSAILVPLRLISLVLGALYSNNSKKVIRIGLVVFGIVLLNTVPYIWIKFIYPSI